MPARVLTAHTMSKRMERLSAAANVVQASKDLNSCNCSDGNTIAEREALVQGWTLQPCERRAVIWRAVSDEKPIIVKNISYFRKYF